VGSSARQPIGLRDIDMPSFDHSDQTMNRRALPARARWVPQRFALPLATLAWSSLAVAQDPPPSPSEPEPVPSTTPSPAPSDSARSPSGPPPATDTTERRALEAEFAAALNPTDTPPPPSAAPSAPTGGAGTLRLLDLSLDLLGVAGTSTASETEMRSLEGGGHDPKNKGFTMQNVELTLAGVVDPYLRGDANIVLLIDETGETVIELEEAYLTSLDLPLNLQLKAGQFFTDFGRINATHPHTWDFVDQPVVNSRFFGADGLRSQGIQLSWLTPLPFFAEVVLSAQNAHGETAVSFRNAPDETVAGRVLIERGVHGLNDLLYLARLRTSFDPAEDLAVVGGLSALFGPNASGTETHTRIYGVDVYLKWRPLDSDQGWPFVTWQTEALLRRYQAAEVLDEAGGAIVSGATLDDAGLYSQLVWGFARPWVAGVRYERASGEDSAFTTPDGSYASNADPLRDSRQRYSGVLSYYPSEFSKLRAQYNYDRAEFLNERDAHSAFVQFEILFGAHGAHKF
jgi:hypothetical protein